MSSTQCIILTIMKCFKGQNGSSALSNLKKNWQIVKITLRTIHYVHGKYFLKIIVGPINYVSLLTMAIMYHANYVSLLAMALMYHVNRVSFLAIIIIIILCHDSIYPNPIIIILCHDSIYPNPFS